MSNMLKNRYYQIQPYVKMSMSSLDPDWQKYMAMQILLSWCKHTWTKTSVLQEKLKCGPYDSPVWREQYSDECYFKGDRMGLSLALKLDGVNPYYNIGVQYSVTPIIITMLNLPKLINSEILFMWNNSKTEQIRRFKLGSICWNSSRTLVFDYSHAYSEYHKAKLSKLFHIHGRGSLCGCQWCFLKGFYCPPLDKVIYLVNRTYLEFDDPLGKCVDQFYDRNVEGK